MRLLIVGAGAIGQWIGANLQQAGAEVVFVGREKFARAALRDGLHVQLPDGGAWRLPQVRACGNVAAAASESPFDAIALCVKAYAVEGAMLEIGSAGVLAPQTRVICFQNGLGAEETVARFAGAERVIAGTLTSAVSLVDATTVKLERAKGGVGLAPLSSIAEQHKNPTPDPSLLGRGKETPLPSGLGVGQIVATFASAALLRTKTCDDAGAMKWSKLLLNLVGNATSALYRRRVADLMDDEFTAQIEMQQLREAEAVMRAAGVRAMNLPGAPAKWFARAIRFLPNALLRWVLARFFANARGDKWPSFYYDVINTTGRSEVMWLNGAVGEWGRRVRVPTPVNDALTRLVIEAVNGRGEPPESITNALRAAVQRP